MCQEDDLIVTALQGIERVHQLVSHLIDEDRKKHPQHAKMQMRTCTVQPSCIWHYLIFLRAPCQTPNFSSSYKTPNLSSTDGRRIQVFEYSGETSRSVNGPGPDEFLSQTRKFLGWRECDAFRRRGRNLSDVRSLVNFLRLSLHRPIIICLFANDII